MTPEERTDKIMADAFRTHEDAVRFRQNYPEDWKLWLRKTILQAIEDAVSDRSQLGAK